MLLAHIKITKLAVITTPPESTYLLALVFPRKNISGVIFLLFCFHLHKKYSVEEKKDLLHME